jgi:hypothetical protein
LVPANDELRPVYRIMRGLGMVAIAILLLGLVEFLHFEPFEPKTGAIAEILGIFAYDPESGTKSGPDASHFNRDQVFAAEVNWSALPPGMIVGARWYNSFQQEVGGAGPKPAGDLTGQPLIPIHVPEGLERNLPGHYTFVVERYARGQPVEVIARRLIKVERTP